jgi:peptidyl-prolyl cis-trans isomerase SurA
MKYKIWTIFLFILSVIASPARAQQTIDGIAAVVGNEIILVSDLNTLIAQYSFQNKVNVYQDPKLLQQLQEQMLRRMIDEKLLLIKADEDTITADEDRVEQILDQQINTFIQQVGSQEKLEEYYGMPLPKIKKEMRQQIANRLIIDQLRQRRFANIKVSRREVENFYEQYQDSLPKMDETVDISHVLLQVTPSDESYQEAYNKILRIQQMLEEGQDFTTLAPRHSEDPSVASNKGDLGWVSRGDLVKEFEEVAFALKEGEISDIVQTQFGFHLIQLVERQGEKIHVRHILIQLQPIKEDEQRVISRLQEIRQRILSGNAAFEDMALQNSGDPNVANDKGHLGLFAVNAFQIKGFEEAVKKMSVGEISEPFRTEFGYHILKLNDRQTSRTLTLDNDWQQIEQITREFKGSRQFEKWLAELREEIPVDVKISI